MDFSKRFLKEVIKTTKGISTKDIETAITLLRITQFGRRNLFIVGNGGSHASASHAVNDFRKICGMNAFTPFDNASEMTAHINDGGWDDSIVAWMELFSPRMHDTLLVLSVGGGNEDKNISSNIINAIRFAKKSMAFVISIVGRKEFAYSESDVSIFIPAKKDIVTPISESFHSVVCHLLVSHPKLKQNETKWESLE